MSTYTKPVDTNELAKQSGSGSPQGPGGGSAPKQSAHDMTQGADAYPGARSGGEEDKPGATPQAGDTDPESTKISEETGQDGSPGDPKKNKAKPWNG